MHIISEIFTHFFWSEQRSTFCRLGWFRMVPSHVSSEKGELLQFNSCHISWRVSHKISLSFIPATVHASLNTKKGSPSGHTLYKWFLFVLFFPMCSIMPFLKKMVLFFKNPFLDIFHLVLKIGPFSHTMHLFLWISLQNAPINQDCWDTWRIWKKTL